LFLAVFNKIVIGVLIMSHITKIKSKITNLNLLKKCLADLKIQYTEITKENKIEIKSWDKKSVASDIKLEIKTGSSYNVGVILNEKTETYEFVADWWGVESHSGIKTEDFINKISQKYAYNNVMDKIKDKGYQIVNEDVDDKQNIRIVLRKWE
jgi:hypothetical protein